jgi:hypothetical protein
MDTKSMVLEHFGRFLMHWGRDPPIWKWDSTVNGHMKDSDSQAIHRALGELTPAEEQFLAELIPFVVDTALKHFLEAMQEEGKRFPISIELAPGQWVELTEVATNLPSQMEGPEGWIARFSTKRLSRRSR